MNRRTAFRSAATGAVFVAGVVAAAALGEPEGDLTPQDLPPAWRVPLGESPRMVIELHEETYDIAISGDGRWLVAARIDDTLLLGKLAGHWSFECVAAGCGLVVLLAVWLLRRVSRRARVVGEPYCRKCNYRLTGSTSAHCPECGVDLTRRRAAIGRPPWRIRAFAAVVLVGAVAAVLLAALNRTGLRSRVERALANWHSRWAYTLRGDEWPEAWQHWCGVLDIYDTTTGRLDRTVEVGLQESTDDMTPSCDGSHIFLTLDRRPFRLARLDLSDDAITIIVEQPDDDGYVGHVAGVTGDAEVYALGFDEHYYIDPMTGRSRVVVRDDEREYMFSRCMLRRAMTDSDDDLKDHLYVQDVRTGTLVADFHEDEWPEMPEISMVQAELLLDLNALYTWRNQSTLEDLKSTVERREYSTKKVSVTMGLPASALEGESHSRIGSIALPVADSRFVLVQQTHIHELGNVLGSRRVVPQRVVVGVWDLTMGRYVHHFDGPFTSFEDKRMHVSADGRTLVVEGDSATTGSPIVCHLFDTTRFAEAMNGRIVKAAK